MSRAKKIKWLQRLKEWQEVAIPTPSHAKSYNKNRRRYVQETNREIKNTDNKFYQQFKRKGNNAE